MYIYIVTTWNLLAHIHHARTNTYRLIYACIYTHINVSCIHICTYMINIHTYTHTHIYIHDSCTHIVCTHTYIQSYMIHTHTYIHRSGENCEVQGGHPKCLSEIPYTGRSTRPSSFFVCMHFLIQLLTDKPWNKQEDESLNNSTWSAVCIHMHKTIWSLCIHILIWRTAHTASADVEKSCDRRWVPLGHLATTNLYLYT